MSRPAYQVNHLFLLMGENPLPNAVAAMTLLQPGGTPYLVHTTHTRLQAERLASVLRTVPTLQTPRYVNLGEHQAEASVIRQQIQTIAATLSGTVGMNYTGGTKVMSVHAYRALAHSHPNAIFSYLDSNTLEMVLDNDDGASSHFKVTLPLTLKQLFQLHGLAWNSHQPPIVHPIQTAVAIQFAHLHRFADWAKVWRSWCNSELRRLAKTPFFHWKPEAELAQLPALSLQGLIDPFKQVLQQHLGAESNTLSLATAQKHGFQRLSQICEWLDGVWLEHYVLHQIQQIAAAAEIHEVRLGFRMHDARAATPPWDKFEFDVAFMRHYQLFALSCTTTDRRSLCKQKLIEANLRARQLGGAEARVGLVCCHDRPDSLRSELEVATRNRKIAVFGRQDLQHLGQKIVNWVQQNG
ncbi:Card1-like endonuclease domain-containing protein [Pantanalinema rosaneae CENA516]|uniref:Card1-like endonuclease domain-containing protein n=1 Tax=Pantanalinema rosaneae TaxID=1620701 RepID=UPI003D6F9243